MSLRQAIPILELICFIDTALVIIFIDTALVIILATVFFAGPPPAVSVSDKESGANETEDGIEDGVEERVYGPKQPGQQHT